MDEERELTLFEARQELQESVSILWDSLVLYPVLKLILNTILFLLPVIEAFSSWTNEDES